MAHAQMIFFLEQITFDTLLGVKRRKQVAPTPRKWAAGFALSPPEHFQSENALITHFLQQKTLKSTTIPSPTWHGRSRCGLHTVWLFYIANDMYQSKQIRSMVRKYCHVA
jgi:hypothetical protein